MNTKVCASVAKPVLLASELSEPPLVASGDTSLTEAEQVRALVVQPVKEEALSQLGALVDEDNRVDKVDVDLGNKKLSIQGSSTRLALSLAGVLLPLSMVVYNGYPITDAYIPMAGMGFFALASSYIEKRNK